MELLCTNYDYRLHNKEVPSIYLYYVHCYAQVCLKKWKNNLPDFYLVRDKIEQQMGLFWSGFCCNEENVTEFLCGVRCVGENIIQKSKKNKESVKCSFFLRFMSHNLFFLIRNSKYKNCIREDHIDFSQHMLFKFIHSYCQIFQSKIVGGSTSGGKLTLEIA